MLRPFLLASLALASIATAQTVLPPWNNHYEVLDLGQMPGVYNYGGLAFMPSDANTLLVSPYASGQIRAVPLVRDAQGQIVGFGTSTLYASVGGTDGGLAFGPGGVLFFTWYGANRLGQIRPGSTTVDKVIDLAPLGVAGSVGACSFVPVGRSGAGRFKIATYSGSNWYELGLVPDGFGTYSVAAVSAATQVQGGPEGILYPPASAPLLGNSVLIAEWNAGIAAYSTDQNGEPMLTSRQLVVAGLSANAGGAIDPVSGDMLFSGGGGRLAVLRAGATCGAIASYGQATAGSGISPTLTGVGCARLGQSLLLRVDGVPNAFGVLALGSYPANYQYLGLTILNNLDVLMASQLGGTGISVIPINLPAIAGLGDRHFYFQAGYFDASTPSGFNATAGIDLWVR